MARAIAGRGVLLDIARLKGVDWLDLGYVDHPRRPRSRDRRPGRRRGRTRRHPAVPHRLAKAVPHPTQIADRVHGRRARHSARTAASGSTTERSPRSLATTGPSRCCRARTPTPSSTCTGAHPRHGHDARRDPRPRGARGGLRRATACGSSSSARLRSRSPRRSARRSTRWPSSSAASPRKGA